MKLTRRQFVILSTAAVVGCGRQEDAARKTSTPASEPTAASSQSSSSELSSVVDVGPLSEFQAEDVYDAFREQGFFVISRDQKLSALSSICTHKGCKVRVASDQSFFCKCHGSKFDREGHVTKGPATRDLRRLAIALDNDKHVLINLNQNASQGPSA